MGKGGSLKSQVNVITGTSLKLAHYLIKVFSGAAMLRRVKMKTKLISHGHRARSGTIVIV